MNTRIAFLGLGIMGSGMSRRLLGAGFPVTVYNRNAAKAEPIVAAGARLAGSPREAAEGADVIISMVADDPASRAMWLGPEGALAGARAGAVCIDSSTVSVSWIRELAQEAKAAGCEFLDAPVTGSKVQVNAGELNFLVGGEAAVIDRVRPVLAPMSKSVIHLGPTGSGAFVKLINNFVCGVQIAAIAEALAFVERTPLDRAKTLEVLMGGSPGSPIVKAVGPRMAASDFTPNFLLRLMAKDLAYASAEAKELGLELSTAATALAAFEAAKTAGLGEKDMSSVVEVIRARR